MIKPSLEYVKIWGDSRCGTKVWWSVESWYIATWGNNIVCSFIKINDIVIKFAKQFASEHCFPLTARNPLISALQILHLSPENDPLLPYK